MHAKNGYKDKSMLGKECYYVDKTTHSKKFEGVLLGKCISESIHPVNNFPIAWFKKPFLGFCWQYKKNIKIKEK